MNFAFSIIKRTPDWLVYGLLLAFIVGNAKVLSGTDDAPLPPPELGPALPNQRPSDPNLIVEIEDPRSGTGTAFAVDNDGLWMTARHVVDSCDEVGLHMGGNKYVKARKVLTSTETDVALITTAWKRSPLPRDLESTRRIGEHGFFIGFPQHKPGEASGKLLGRNKMKVRGRYRTSEPVLVWAETGRTRNLNGSLGGLSGGPTFDADGEVIGVVTAESKRRGRVYTVAPYSLTKSLQDLPNPTSKTQIDMGNYGRVADKYRRDRRVAEVICVVK